MPVRTVTRSMAVDTVSMSIDAIDTDGCSVAAIAVCEVDCDHLRRVTRCRFAAGVWAHFESLFEGRDDGGARGDEQDESRKTCIRPENL